MKKIFKTLFIFGLFVSAAFLGSIFSADAAEATNCTIKSAYFTPNTGINEKSEITLTINPGHEDCWEKRIGFEVSIVELDTIGFDEKVYSESHLFYSTGEPFILKFTPGSEQCSEKICKYYLEIETQNRDGGFGQTKEVAANTWHTSDYEGFGVKGLFSLNDNARDAGRLQFIPLNPDGIKTKFKRISELKPQTEASALSTRCQIIEGSVVLSPHGKQPGFLNPDRQSLINLQAKTKNCTDKLATIQIATRTGSFFNYNEVADSATVTGYINESGDIKISWVPGHDDCDEEGQNGRELYCNYGVAITINGYLLHTSPSGPVDDRVDKIWYECSGTCDAGTYKDWKLNDSNLKEDDRAETVGSEVTVDLNSPCAIDGEYDENCYEFLAPLPGFESFIGDPKDGISNIEDNNSEGRVAIKNLAEFELGDFVNSIFQIALGILMVLAVIMIVIAGVEYMTVESIYGKSEAKTKITGAVTGLILALGIFLILGTIDKRLLEVNFGSRISVAEIDVDSAPKKQADGSYRSSNNKVYSVNNIIQKYGMPWKPKDTATWQTLRNLNNIYINKSECTKIGESCTSVYFEEETYKKIKKGLEAIQKKCNCKFTITGGSEFWLHQTHGPSSATVDISVKAKGKVTSDDIKKLNQALSCGEYSYFPVGKTGYKYRSETPCISGVLRYAEGGAQEHWHLDFI